VVLTALCEHAPFDLVAYRDAMFLDYRGVPRPVGVRQEGATPIAAVS
jgi:hypothetical protein